MKTETRIHNTVLIALIIVACIMFNQPYQAKGELVITDEAVKTFRGITQTASELASTDRFPVIEDDHVFQTAWTPEENMANFLRYKAKLGREEAEKTAKLLWQAANDAEYQTTTDRHLLAWVGLCLSIPEAGGHTGHMAGYYHGLLQVGKLHEPNMQKAGLSYDREYDCVLFGLLKIGRRINEGQSLRKALTPWAQTRGEALRLLDEVDQQGLRIEH